MILDPIVHDCQLQRPEQLPPVSRFVEGAVIVSYSRG
jgi:hypothetical protein